MSPPNLDLLRAKVNDRSEHYRRITALHYGGSADAAGEVLDGAGDGVEAVDQLRPVDAPGREATDHASLPGDLLNEHLLRSTHLLQLAIELLEARLDLIEATLGISHGRSVDEFELLREQLSTVPSSSGEAAA